MPGLTKFQAKAWSFVNVRCNTADALVRDGGFYVVNPFAKSFNFRLFALIISLVHAPNTARMMQNEQESFSSDTFVPAYIARRRWPRLCRKG